MPDRKYTPPKEIKNRPMSKKELHYMLSLAKEGKSTTEIAHALNFTEGRIQKYLKVSLPNYEKFFGLFELVETKGFIRILLILYENKEIVYSKFGLRRDTKLSLQTINKRLKTLKSFNLIKENLEVGPRKRTEIKLTEMGKKIAGEFFKAKQLYSKMKLNS